MKSTYTKPFLIAAFIVLADQILKTWVRTHMYLGEEIKLLGNHGFLHYTENNGMAFGWELGGEAGKLALTLFRLVYLIRHKYHRGLILTIALIFAGALGNIIDSAFYGQIYHYAPLFQGRVVDMFYFPLLTGIFPSWAPVWGGEEYIFFRPVFNIADAAISIGVVLILLNQKKYFKEDIKEEPQPNSEIVEE